MSTAMQTDVEIRWMVRRDLAAALAVEAECFPEPWSEEDFLQVLRNRSVIALAAFRGDELTGFIVYELEETRLKILNLAVAWRFRREGIASAIMRRMIGKLSPFRRTEITLEINERNLTGQLFFKQCGFRATGIVHRDEPSGDAYAMCYRIEEPS